MMPQGTATTTTISRLSDVPPRARHRRLPMIMATMIPAMMQSAYARTGRPKASQTPVLGLGMDSVRNAMLLTVRDSPGRLIDHGLQSLWCQASEVELCTVEEHRRRA